MYICFASCSNTLIIIHYVVTLSIFKGNKYITWNLGITPEVMVFFFFSLYTFNVWCINGSVSSFFPYLFLLLNLKALE